MGTRPAARRSVAAALVFLSAALMFLSRPSPGRAGPHGYVPVAIQLPIFLKVLSYDRAMSRENAAPISIVAVYVPGVTPSERAASAFLSCFESFAGKTIFDRPIVGRAMAWAGADSFSATLQREPTTSIYIAEGCEPYLPLILRASQERRLISLGGTLGMVEEGAAIGVGERDGRPEIVVNLPQSRREGADLPAQLLNLCRVIR